MATYKEVHSRESSKISDRQAKLTKGVSKLTEAKEVVKRLKSEAAQQETQLAEKQSEANDALQMITDTMKNANQQKVHNEKYEKFGRRVRKWLLKISNEQRHLISIFR